MALSVSTTALPEVKIVIPQTLSDSRGLFSEVYNRRDFEAAGLFLNFVQDNHSTSTLSKYDTRPTLSAPTLCSGQARPDCARPHS